MSDSTRVLQEKLTKKSGKVQKILSTASSFFISIRFPGETITICLGRGGNCFGPYIVNEIPPPRYRIFDSYLGLFRKELKNWSFTNLKRINNALIFNFKKGEVKKELVLGRRSNRLTFLFVEHGDGKLHFFGGRAHKRQIVLREAYKEQLNDHINQYAQEDIDRFNDVDQDILLGKYLIKNQKKVFRSKRKFLKRKIEKISNDLLRCQKWPKLYEYAQNSENNFDFNPPSFELLGIKIPLKMRKNEAGQAVVANLIFEKAKKLKKGEAILKKRLEQTRKEFDKSCLPNNDRSEDEIVFKRVELPYLDVTNKGEVSTKQSRDVTYYKLREISIAIGKNTYGNDYLRNKWANKEDIWCHIAERPSAHLIVKVKNLQQLSSLELEAIASALRDQSGQESLEIDIVYSHVKDIKGKKGQAGGVLIKRPRYLRVKYQKNWEEILSTVP